MAYEANYPPEEVEYDHEERELAMEVCSLFTFKGVTLDPTFLASGPCTMDLCQWGVSVTKYKGTLTSKSLTGEVVHDCNVYEVEIVDDEGELTPVGDIQGRFGDAITLAIQEIVACQMYHRLRDIYEYRAYIERKELELKEAHG
jgi:hypothetical protein